MASPSIFPSISPPKPTPTNSSTRTPQTVRFSPASPTTTDPMASSRPTTTTTTTQPAAPSAQLEAGATTESSGDEITPIVPRERGLARGKNYDGTTSSTGSNRRELASGESGGGRRPRRRRKRNGSGRGGGGADGDGDGDGDEEEEEEDGGEGSEERAGGGVGAWLRGVAEKYGSVELDNKGSVARDHLALERTFLAWLRTSLAFASIGIAITQLFRLNTAIQPPSQSPSPNQPFHLAQVGKPLGATFLGIAILVLLLGGRRYFESQYWIVRGKFPASRGSIFVITGVAVGVIVGSLVLVLSVDPGVYRGR